MSSFIGPQAQEVRRQGKDSISAFDPQFSSVSSSAVQTAAGTVLTLAPGEIGVIENVNNVALFVKLGAGAAAGSYNKILKAGTAAADGTAGNWVITNWVGDVSVFSASTYSYVAYKLQ
jgi:hypothetical protein